MDEKPLEEQIKLKAQEARKVARYMSGIEELVEERIRKAQEKGAFDNLEGKGKPLNLYENPFEPPELRMAFRMLKNAGFAPYWVELGKDIDANRQLWKEEIERFKQRVVMVSHQRGFARDPRFLARKENFYAEQRERLIKINRMIDDFNLQCPTFQVTRGRVNVEEEMMNMIIEIEEFIEEVSARPKANK